MNNMHIHHKRQSQFELFPRIPADSGPAAGLSPRIKDLTLSLENIIVLSIISVMVLVFFFSLGVEKGKRAVRGQSHAASDGADLVRMAEGAAGEQPAGPSVQTQQGEEVVFPVDAPQDVVEETEPAFQPPLEKKDEQEKLFTIQVASFKLEKNAKQEADRLKSIGHDEIFVVPKGSYSIVCVGKFAQQGEAKKFSRRLKSRYHDCLVRRL